MDCLEGSRLKRPSIGIQCKPGRRPPIHRGVFLSYPIDWQLTHIANCQNLGGCAPLLQHAKIQARRGNSELAW